MAGQEHFKPITKSFINGTNGIVFVYDLTDNNIFKSVKIWIKDSESYEKFESKLYGNK